MGFVFPVENFSGTGHCGELEMALGTCDEPWEDQSWEEPEEAEFPDDDWTDEFPPDDPELEDQFGSLEAAEAYAVTEFKNASSDMKNPARTFMEAKDLVSRVQHARGYFPAVGVGAFDGFQKIKVRGSRQAGSGKGANTGMNSQTGKGRGRGLGKGKPPRDSRRPSPAKSRVTLTGSAKGGPTHGTRIQPGQCLLCRQMGHLARDCPNRGTRDDSGINLKRAFGSFVGMTGDRDVSLPHVPVVIWLSLLVSVEQFLFGWCHQPALSSAKHGCCVGTQTEPQSIPPSPSTQQRTPRTVLITENGMKSTKVVHSSTVCSTLNRSMTVTSFRQCTQCPSPSVGIFAEWAAFAVEDVKGYALLDTGASRSVGGYMMVQYVVDCLSRNTAPPWLESADPAVSFTFAGEERRLIQRLGFGCRFQERGMSVLQCTLFPVKSLPFCWLWTCFENLDW